MKKTLIAVAAAAALATSSAFAEITFGAWLRVLAAPVASNGDDVIVGMENSWGWGARTARLDINAVSEDGKAGFAMGVFNDVGGIGMGDRASMWVKPIDMLKVSVGKYDSPDNGLRGDFTYGSWAWLRPYNWAYDGEGLTFDGIWRQGLMLELDPVEGLHVFAVVPMSTSYDKAEDVYKNIQAGFGYTIEGVGRIKAQYIGDYSSTGAKDAVKEVWGWSNDTDKKGNNVLDPNNATRPEWQKLSEAKAAQKDEDKTTGQIGVAFDLTAVENLYVTIGARFGIADKDYAPDYLKMAFTAGVSYQITEEFKVSVDGGFKMFQDKCIGKADDLDDKVFFVGAGIDYALMDGLALTADVRYMSLAVRENKDENYWGYGKDGDDGAFSFLVGVNKSVGSNGSIGIAFQGATNGCGLVTNDGSGIVAAPDGDEFCWAIPVSVSVWF
ncbi:MAG: hypothetical protein J6K96_12120 [Treponema sp.]|nr:hypothetical protein [Treponema sp.]